MTKNITVIDDEDDEIIEDIALDFKKTCFFIAGRVKRKSGEYTRIIMVNRWAWMTDEQLRPIYKPIKEYLEQEKSFKEKSKGVMEVDMLENDCKEYLLSLGMIENNTLIKAANLIK